VVVGEMGSVKKEIALLGDKLNTAAPLVDACRDSGEHVIASADLLDRLVLPPDVKAQSLGLIRLRGKEQAIGLCALTRAVSNSAIDGDRTSALSRRPTRLMSMSVAEGAADDVSAEHVSELDLWRPGPLHM
jgi:hypothetical protein